MSRLKEFHQLEDALKKQMARLDKIKNEDEFIAELEFEKKLKLLMTRYEKCMDDVMAILNSDKKDSTYAVQEKGAIYSVKSKPATRKNSAKR